MFARIKLKLTYDERKSIEEVIGMRGGFDVDLLL